MPVWLTNLFSDQVLASWAQAAIYLATLFVLIAQARILVRQTRSHQETVRLQTEAMRQAEYLRCQIDFTETMRLMIQAGLHKPIYDNLLRAGSAFAGWANYTYDEKQCYAYIEMIYELFERVFVIWKDRWIPDDEWQRWEAWMLDVIRHPLFSDVHRDNLGMFDPRFEKYIQDHLPPTNKTSSVIPQKT